MPEINRDPRPISETEGEHRKIRDRIKKRKRRLSERQEGKTRIRKRVKKEKPKLSEKRRLSEEKRVERETKTETEKVEIVEPKKKKEKAKKYKKKYCDMTKDEVVDLCFFLDRPRARLVVDDLRNYLIQVSESERFDCDVYPGRFSGVTSVSPVRYCRVNPILRDHPELLAVSAITKYNLANHETEYEVVDVEKANVYVDMQCTYFVTFNARDVKANDGALKTFQAIVVAKYMPPEQNRISYVRLCRPKLC